MTGDDVLELLGCAHDDPRVSPLLATLSGQVIPAGRSVLGSPFDPPGIELAFKDGTLEAASFGDCFEALPYGLNWSTTIDQLRDATTKEIPGHGGEPGGTSAEYERDGTRVLLVFDFGTLINVTAWLADSAS